jgi:hypothetical protein
MTTLAVIGITALLIIVVVLSELAAATLPILVVVALVPHEERRQLAELIAAVDSRRRLRLWPALRTAVAARRARPATDPPIPAALSGQLARRPEATAER